MKKIIILLIFFFGVLLTHANAETITRLYAYSAVDTQTNFRPVILFDDDMGELEEVNVSIRGIISGTAYNYTYPYSTGFNLNIQHSFFGVNSGFSNITPAQISMPVVVNNPIQPLPASVIDLNFTVNQYPLDHFIPTFSGYTTAPTIYSKLEDFYSDGEPSTLDFQQIVNQSVFVDVYTTLFMQIDYKYNPSIGSDPSIIGPVQMDSSFNRYFSEITSVQQITENQLYAIAAQAPVPEPATILLLGTGLVGFAAGTRRKMKKA